MKIIVDMMGGDNAPLAVLEGAAQAVKEYGVQLIGVGNEALVRKTAAEHNIPVLCRNLHLHQNIGQLDHLKHRQSLPTQCILQPKRNHFLSLLKLTKRQKLN